MTTPHPAIKLRLIQPGTERAREIAAELAAEDAANRAALATWRHRQRMACAARIRALGPDLFARLSREG